MEHPYVHALRRSAARNPHGLAIVDVGGMTSATWSELAVEVERLAGVLAGTGLGPGDRVVVRQYNSLPYLRTVLALGWIGAIPIPTLGILGPTERAHIDTITSAACIIDPSTEIAGVCAGTSAPYDGPPTSLSQILFTSGSSGQPKGVMHTFASTAAAMAGWLAVSDLERDDVVIVSTPVSHAAGRLFEGALLAGAATVLLPNARAHGLVEAVHRYGGTHMIVVPTVLAEFLDHEDATAESLPSLQFVMYASAPASPRLIVRAHERLGPILHSCYGSTEAPLPLTHLNARDHMRAVTDTPDLLLSCGAEFEFGCQVRVVDESMREVPPGHTGQLVVSTPGLACGYWQQEDVWEGRVNGDWFLTGDLGSIRDGHVYLVDRQDDMIITGGFNVYPTEVENWLCEHPEVRDAAVIGVPDSRWGEAVVAVVSTRGDIEADALLAHCQQGLSKHKVPKEIHLVDDLPTSGHGKVSRRHVREMLMSGGPVIHGAG